MNEKLNQYAGVDLEQHLHEIMELAVEKGIAEAELQYRDEMRKCVLADACEKVRKLRESEKLTEARIEQLARQSKQYRNHLQAIKEQKELTTRLQAVYYYKRNMYDLATTKISFAQSEMKLTR